MFRLLLLCFLILASCNSNKQEGTNSYSPGKSEMEDVNRYLVQKDRERIENYIERKKLRMTMTESGLWYSVTIPGTGPRLNTNDAVRIEYICSLLDGTICYSSDQSGPKNIVVGKSSIESGLDQGLRLLGRGGEAIFIMPSFLAHGLVGDGDRIPALSVLVYNVKVIDINNNK